MKKLNKPMSDDPLAYLDRSTVGKIPRTLAESRAIVAKRAYKPPPAKYIRAYKMALNKPVRRAKLKLGWYRGQPKYVNLAQRRTA